jgi:hypothetical protein
MTYEPSNHRRSRLSPMSAGATRPHDGDLRTGFLITAVVVLLGS